MDTPTPTVTLPAEVAESIAARLRIDLEAAARENEAHNQRADREAIAAEDARKDLAALDSYTVTTAQRTAMIEKAISAARGRITRHSNAAADARRAAGIASKRFYAIDRDLSALSSAQRAAR